MNQSARVFFALWPDARLRAELARTEGMLHEQLGGRRMQPDSLHLTLVFIGQMELARLPEVMTVAAAIESVRFDILFDSAACWRHNRIACLGASQVPLPLVDLVEGLESGLKEAGIAFDRRPYKPHVTLLRNADCRKTFGPAGPETKNPAFKAINWPARDFVLVKSSLRPDGARYEELGRWSLLASDRL